MSDYKPLYDNSFALIIGIDSYGDPHFPTPGNAASDAKSITDLIVAPPFNAASFFLRESRPGTSSGAARKVELVMQRKKPQKLVNTLDALVPDTADRVPVPDTVKQGPADLAPAEAAS